MNVRRHLIFLWGSPEHQYELSCQVMCVMSCPKYPRVFGKVPMCPMSVAQSDSQCKGTARLSHVAAIESPERRARGWLRVPVREVARQQQIALKCGSNFGLPRVALSALFI